MTILTWLGRLILGLAATAAAWGAWYVIYHHSLEATKVEKTAKPETSFAVEVVEARRDTIEERIGLVGTLLPIAETEVRSRIDGYIISSPFDIGDEIKKDDILFRLDDDEQKEAVSRARATLAVATAQLAAKEAELALTQKILEREQQLIKSQAGSRSQLETAQANLEIARANKELEEARVSEAQATLDSMQLALDDMVLEAPIDGVVATRMADVGDLAKPDVPLLSIVNLQTVRTNVNVTEKDYQKIKVGQSTTITVDGFPGEAFTGKVTRIAPVLDPATRTASVQIDVPNKQGRLKPGMFARVSLNSEKEKSGILVPLAALTGGGRPTVYVVDDDSKIEARAVRLGTSNGQVVEILSGITDGDRVVTLGNRIAKPGQQVVTEAGIWPAPQFVSTETISVPATESGE